MKRNKIYRVDVRGRWEAHEELIVEAAHEAAAALRAEAKHRVESSDVHTLLAVDTLDCVEVCCNCKEQLSREEIELDLGVCLDPECLEAVGLDPKEVTSK